MSGSVGATAQQAVSEKQQCQRNINRNCILKNYECSVERNWRTMLPRGWADDVCIYQVEALSA